MAVKYQRDDIEMPFRKWVAGPSPAQGKRASILIAMVVGGVLMVWLAISMRNTDPFDRQPVLQGEALVQAREIWKATDGSSVHVLRLKVMLSDGRVAENNLDVEEARWRTLNTGDRVSVAYKLSRDGTRVRLLHLYEVAPNVPVR
ncbi:MAG TPA: hypothetical protein PLI09_11720 [Candidatus Hydrogenedentes bacterium]|nr:hypothetical protein [Candidatus Hydrogenedentota bacterium]